jgi:hypothetical protein
VLFRSGTLFGTNPVWTSEAWYFVSVPGAIAALLALLRWRRTWPLAARFGVWLWLSAGTAATPSLYAALRELPVFSLLRNAERFLVPAVLTVSLAVALAINHAVARVRLRQPPRASWPVLGLVLLGLGLALAWQLHNFDVAAGKRALSAPPVEQARPFHQARGNRWSAASFGPASRGSLACWEAYGLPQSPALRADLTQES